MSPEHIYSLKSHFRSAKHDPILKKYATRQAEIPLDTDLLLGEEYDNQTKLHHLESVMFSLLCGRPGIPEFHHNMAPPNMWLKHHIRMLDFPDKSIQYDLDELARLIKYPRSKKEFESTRDWNRDVILSLTLQHKHDEETCRRLSLVLFKISKTADIPALYSPNHASIISDIKVFVKMGKLTHLQHMLTLVGEVEHSSK
ncbi:hypothetical protein HK100_012835 [Physocladia obscura]|uniref:Uncharacterized protein n=1 Tax=Physocladia obscura TaxID=109957 RepID=A0AAD5T076_9FUNG|nr:hypothetical protein HK100_012835 [Physocladia obscura]